MKRFIGFVALCTAASWASTGGADNYVTWTVRVGPSSTSATSLTMPVPLFQDRLLPTKGERWRCLADKILRQDERGNTYGEMSVRCSDGETTVTSLASCQVGAHGSDRLFIELVEKTSAIKNGIWVQCQG
jgi:hypothetical protein